MFCFHFESWVRGSKAVFSQIQTIEAIITRERQEWVKGLESLIDWLISSFIFGFIFWSPPSRTMDLSNAFLVLPLDKKSHRGWPCQLSSSGLDWLEAVKPSHLTEWPSRNSFWVCRRTHFKVPLTFIHFSFDFRISQDVYAEKPLFYSWTREQWIHMKWIRLFHTGLFVPRLPSFCRIQLNEPW